jgi:hypothetical protein
MSVCLSVTPLLQRVESHMSKGNKESQPERTPERFAGSYDITLYTEYFKAQFT